MFSDAPLCFMAEITCKAISGAKDLNVAKLSLLSKSVGVTVVAKFFQQDWTGLPLSNCFLREKLWDQMVEHWSQRKWVSSAWSYCSYSATTDIFYMWSLRLCDYLKSSHICLLEINNQKPFIAIDLVRTIMEWLWMTSHFGASFWSLGSLMLCVHLSPQRCN